MNSRGNCLLWACLIMGLILGSVTSVFAEEPSGQTVNKELFKQAIALKEKGDYEAALEIFRKIISDCGKDQLLYIDVSVEQCMILKDANNRTWVAKAKEAGYKIKTKYYESYQNPDYWVVYAKYSALVEKENHVNGAFRKLFYFRPGYVEGYIAQGDIYTYMAMHTDPSETSDDTGNAFIYEADKHAISIRIERGNTAKKAYETALVTSTLDKERKAYVCYKLGKLEMEIFSNKEGAVKNWKKAVAIAPESVYGQQSVELLKSNQ